MYLFRSRDRRLMEQTERDVALTLQRDYYVQLLVATGKKSTEYSTKVLMYNGYIGTYPNIDWIPGSQVDAAFTVLEQLLTQLSKGSYQASPPVNVANPGIWPVSTISSPTEGWIWIRSLYASINPAYATWLTANSIPYNAWA